MTKIQNFLILNPKDDKVLLAEAQKIADALLGKDVVTLKGPNSGWLAANKRQNNTYSVEFELASKTLLKITCIGKYVQRKPMTSVMGAVALDKLPDKGKQAIITLQLEEAGLFND